VSEKWIWLNGKFCLEKEALIPVTDHGFLFGEGIFTTMRVQEGKCEFFPRHLQRLQRQAEALDLNWHSLSFKSISELIERNQAWKGIWRLKMIATVSEKEGKREVGNLLAMMQPAQDLTFAPCTLCLFPYPIESPLAHIKSLSYLDHLYVREYAKRRGFTDAITQMGNGVLLETGCSNLFWIDQEVCWIPDLQLPYLKGIFLQSILPHLTMPIHFIKATCAQMPPSASVYICNALTHIRPVLSIDDVSFPRNLQKEEQLQQATARALQGNE
jgi:4-amino-4-deoxychorismate lyase